MSRPLAPPPPGLYDPPTASWIDASAKASLREKKILGWLYQVTPAGILGQVFEHGGQLLARARGTSGRYDIRGMDATPENLLAIMENIERIVRGEEPDDNGWLEDRRKG